MNIIIQIYYKNILYNKVYLILLYYNCNITKMGNPNKQLFLHLLRNIQSLILPQQNQLLVLLQLSLTLFHKEGLSILFVKQVTMMIQVY